MTQDRQSLRRRLRRARRDLSPAQRAHAARSIADHVARHWPLPRRMRIAAFLSFGHELDTAPLLELAARRRWEVFVPRIQSLRSARMRFVRLQGALHVNRYGIPEPQARGPADRIDPRWLDVVFVPLLGVGPNGERLGAGAGFYDRAFAHRRLRRAWRKPLLVGLAYDVQRLNSFADAPWDVPLDALITESGFHRFEAT